MARPTMKQCIDATYIFLRLRKKPMHYQDLVAHVVDKFGIDVNSYYTSKKSRFDENFRTSMQIDERFRFLNDAGDQFQGKGTGVFGLKEWYTDDEGQIVLSFNSKDGNLKNERVYKRNFKKDLKRALAMRDLK